jgi:hypothetical protein
MVEFSRWERSSKVVHVTLHLSIRSSSPKMREVVSGANSDALATRDGGAAVPIICSLKQVQYGRFSSQSTFAQMSLDYVFPAS